MGRFSQIEDVVNSKEVEQYSNTVIEEDELYPVTRSWEDTWIFIKSRVEGEWPKSFWERLEIDLRDWWKNGNLRYWEEGEVNAFGMDRWRLGDEEFWLLDNDGEVLEVQDD